MDDTQATPARTDDGRRRWWRLLAAAVVLTLVVLALAWPSFADHRRRLAAGTVYETSFAFRTTHAVSVRLPWGVLRLSSTDPRTSLPHDVEKYDVGGDVRPPDGGRFVGFSWSSTSVASVSTRAYSSGPTAHRTRIAFVSGPHRYDLNPSHTGNPYCASDIGCVGAFGLNRVWAAVPDDSSPVRLAVEYDGVTQTVDMGSGHVTRGRAADLADVRATTPDCGAPSWSAGFAGHKATCEVSLVTTPYVGGLGWARAGRVWVAVSVSVERPYYVTRRVGRPARFYAVSGTTDLSLALAGGRRAARQVGTGGAGALGPQSYLPGDSEAVVFDAPERRAGGLTVRARWGLDPSSDEETTAATSYVTASWAVRS